MFAVQNKNPSFCDCAQGRALLDTQLEAASSLHQACMTIQDLKVQIGEKEEKIAELGQRIITLTQSNDEQTIALKMLAYKLKRSSELNESQAAKIQELGKKNLALEEVLQKTRQELKDLQNQLITSKSSFGEYAQKCGIGNEEVEKTRSQIKKLFDHINKKLEDYEKEDSVYQEDAVSRNPFFFVGFHSFRKVHAALWYRAAVNDRFWGPIIENVTVEIRKEGEAIVQAKADEKLLGDLLKLDPPKRRTLLAEETYQRYLNRPKNREID